VDPAKTDGKVVAPENGGNAELTAGGGKDGPPYGIGSQGPGTEGEPGSGAQGEGATGRHGEQDSMGAHVLAEGTIGGPHGDEVATAAPSSNTFWFVTRSYVRMVVMRPSLSNVCVTTGVV
jgi:hypothetical protein